MKSSKKISDALPGNSHNNIKKTLIGTAHTKCFKRQPHKMVKHTQKIRRLLPTNCLSAFDHFVLLALKGLNEFPHLKKNLPQVGLNFG